MEKNCQQLYNYQVYRVGALGDDQERKQGSVWRHYGGGVTEVLCAVTILLTLLLAILVSVTGLEIWLLGGTASPSHFPFCIISCIAGPEAMNLLAYFCITSFWAGEAR